MKKGQAAMEFLMTYGWAILVVMAAIGALAYFGVLTPEKYIPESCVLEQGIGCADFMVTQTAVIMYLQNGLGKNIDITNITVGDCSVEINDRLMNTESMTVTLDCETGKEGDVFKEKIVIHYSSSGSPLKQTIRGDMVAKVPPE